MNNLFFQMNFSLRHFFLRFKESVKVGFSQILGEKIELSGNPATPCSLTRSVLWLVYVLHVLPTCKSREDLDPIENNTHSIAEYSVSVKPLVCKD